MNVDCRLQRYKTLQDLNKYQNNSFTIKLAATPGRDFLFMEFLHMNLHGVGLGEHFATDATVERFLLRGKIIN